MGGLCEASRARAQSAWATVRVSLFLNRHNSPRASTRPFPWQRVPSGYLASSSTTPRARTCRQRERGAASMHVCCNRARRGERYVGSEAENANHGSIHSHSIARFSNSCHTRQVSCFTSLSLPPLSTALSVPGSSPPSQKLPGQLPSLQFLRSALGGCVTMPRAAASAEFGCGRRRREWAS